MRTRFAKSEHWFIVGLVRRPAILLPLSALVVVALWADETTSPSQPLPRGFVDLGLRIPSLKVAIRYHGTDNFLGHRVDGYVTGRGVASLELAKAQGELAAQVLGLKVFDAYRPQRAVDQFVRWANDPNDTATKASFFPNVAKPRLIQLGYIAK
jgi:D-alanyl-D-alanine dipeptidase